MNQIIITLTITQAELLARYLSDALPDEEKDRDSDDREVKQIIDYLKYKVRCNDKD